MRDKAGVCLSSEVVNLSFEVEVEGLSYRVTHNSINNSIRQTRFDFRPTFPARFALILDTVFKAYSLPSPSIWTTYTYTKVSQQIVSFRNGQRVQGSTDSFSLTVPNCPCPIRPRTFISPKATIVL